uniref:Uncharacterized protein n=1 Tax=Salix viminalis TaxID=40686 RepID=A0A6N2N787_SALVM
MVASHHSLLLEQDERLHYAVSIHCSPISLSTPRHLFGTSGDTRVILQPKVSHHTFPLFLNEMFLQTVSVHCNFLR